MEIISFKDIIISIIIIILIFFYAFIYSKKIKDVFLIQTLYSALFVKTIFILAGGILLHYSKSGDTVAYFQDTQLLSDVLLKHPEEVINLLTKNYSDLSQETQSYFSPDYVFQTPGHNSGRVATFGLIPYLFFGGSYMGLSFTFSAFAFIASWNFFLTLIKIYPSAKKQLAFVIFFIPSIAFWGCGYLKDPLSQGGILFFVYAALEIIYFKQVNLRILLVLICSFRVVLIIKSYIVLGILPFILFLVYSEVKNYSFKKSTKIIISITILLTSVSLIAYLLNDTTILGRFALDTILTEIQNQQEGYELQEQGSFVNVQQYDGSVIGLVKMFPVGIGLTFLRPFPWEINSILMLLASLENVIIYFLIFNLLRINRFNIFVLGKKIYKNKLALIFFFYSILLGAFIGMSNPNFGTLSRYRITPLTFFLIVLVILISKVDSSRIKSRNENK